MKKLLSVLTIVIVTCILGSAAALAHGHRRVSSAGGYSPCGLEDCFASGIHRHGGGAHGAHYYGGVNHQGVKWSSHH